MALRSGGWKLSFVFSFVSLDVDYHTNKNFDYPVEACAYKAVKRPSAAELSDFGCFTIMACGVILLQQTA
ncbi:hypothetical protein RchiOBHm_Chr5g0078431 [Rosa chinensis]|uniref:Uncharacterized protein n=1 Tax=Rosa chinensis TaxID=74649 RepID=A0A2P6QMA4_ROSCH|nr:hypothetical protein RchiOBHm_Chr5g0078431 [Rosa chinensis]